MIELNDYCAQLGVTRYSFVKAMKLEGIFSQVGLPHYGYRSGFSEDYPWFKVVHRGRPVIYVQPNEELETVLSKCRKIDVVKKAKHGQTGSTGPAPVQTQMHNMSFGDRAKYIREHKRNA